MTTVFVSYAGEDRAEAARLAHALEACGWSVWWDRKVKAGQHFDLVIERELDAAKAVVVLWSKSSVNSEWVKSEAAAAADRGVLIPALIEDCRLPLEFRRRQAADLIGWEGDPADAGFRELSTGVAELTGLPAMAARADPVASEKAPLRKPLWIAGGIAAAAVLLGLAGYASLRLLAPESDELSPAKPPPATAELERTVQEPTRPADLTPKQPVDSPGAALGGKAGVLEFKWPGADCWSIFRGDERVQTLCGGGKQALEAGTYIIKSFPFAVFVPFSIEVKPGLVTSTDATAGWFEFNWPGGDCWGIYRGDERVQVLCGGGKQALQAGTYSVKPFPFAVFVPFSIDVKPGAVTSTDATAGWLEFKWPGADCWGIYRGDEQAQFLCGGGKQALQAGTYMVKPLHSAVFKPFNVRVTRGQTASAP